VKAAASSRTADRRRGCTARGAYFTLPRKGFSPVHTGRPLTRPGSYDTLSAVAPSANAGRCSSPTTITTPPIINPTNDPVWLDSVPGLLA